MSNYNITLLDGRELPCVMKVEQPSIIKDDALQLDTTGEYLQFSRRKPKTVKKDLLQEAQRQYNHYILTENAWFLLANAEKILSDSRMFLAPVNIQNGLAYTGTSGFWKPTLGIYLEWWLYFTEASRDKNGDLVWFISGSPLSGSNCCSVVTRDGEQKQIAQRTSFSAIWRSFMDVNNRYAEAKQRCEAYSLEDVLIKLRGEDYKYRIIELQYEMIQLGINRDKHPLEKAYYYLITQLDKLVNANKRIQLKQHQGAILEFYEKYLVRQHRINELEKVYVAKHKELKKQLHDNTLQGDYHQLLAEASREYKAKKREQSELIKQFIKETFGQNPNNITPTDVIRYASGKPLKIGYLFK